MSTTMTAKRALTYLRGQQMITKGDIVLAKRGHAPVSKLNSLLEALEYAEAAVFADKADGRSSLKRAAEVGFVARVNV